MLSLDSVYNMFPKNLKKNLKKKKKKKKKRNVCVEKRYSDDNELIDIIQTWSDGRNSDFYRSGCISDLVETLQNVVTYRKTL